MSQENYFDYIAQLKSRCWAFKLMYIGFILLIRVVFGLAFLSLHHDPAMVKMYSITTVNILLFDIYTKL